MSGMIACAGCGKNVPAGAAYIREDGQYCPECNTRKEMAADQARLDGREKEDLQESLNFRARRLAKIHAVMWATLVIVLAGGRDGWYSALLAVPVVLAFGLATRKPWAYPAALGLDGAAIAGAAALAVLGAGPSVVPIFAGLCGVFLLAMTVLLRGAFQKGPAPASDPEVPNLMSRR